jgi:hypothetical protein
MRFENSISLAAGAYAASGFGTNSFLGARYNYYILGGRYFVEASFGVSSLRSRVLESVTQAQVYASEKLYTYEFVGAYDPNPVCCHTLLRALPALTWVGNRHLQAW